jgi:anaphase-promoting complex subunit 10
VLKLKLVNRSDGPQPHTISIHFAKRVFVSRMRLYLDHDKDESYTPTKISISSGTGYHDLQEVTIMNLEHPKGWINVDLDGVGPG